MCLSAITASAQSAKHSDIEEADEIKIKKSDGKKLPLKFNHDRSFAISINRGIPGSSEMRKRLATLLADNGQLNEVVFIWFGTVKPQTIEIKIGRRIPIEIAQAVVKVLSHLEDTSVVLSALDDKVVVSRQKVFNFGYSQRVIMGSLVQSKRKPITKEITAALLKEGLTQAEFFRVLSKTE